MQNIKQCFNSKEEIDCLRGNADPHEIILSYLACMKYEHGPKTFFNEYYQHDKLYIDHELLKHIEYLRNRGIRVFLATDQDKYRKNFLY